MLNSSYSSQIWNKVEGIKQYQPAGSRGGVGRRAPLDRVSAPFELSSLVFTSKDMKEVAESRTARPQFLSLESRLSAAAVSFQEATGTIDSH